MPQLDIVSYFPQFFWFCIFCCWTKLSFCDFQFAPQNKNKHNQKINFVEQQKIHNKLLNQNIILICVQNDPVQRENDPLHGHGDKLHDFNQIKEKSQRRRNLIMVFWNQRVG